MAVSIEQVGANLKNTNQTVEVVATSVRELVRSIDQVQGIAERISQGAADAASAVARLDGSVHSIAEASRTVEQASQKAAEDAQSGGRTVQSSIEGLGRIRASIETSATSMRQLDDRAGEIGSIVDMIRMIAERTNLLSLNASIEAARAGEAGRGFAVVAEEIRNLADRAAKATMDISNIVRGLQRTAQDAVRANQENLRVAEEGSVLATSRGRGTGQDHRQRLRDCSSLQPDCARHPGTDAGKHQCRECGAQHRRPG